MHVFFKQKLMVSVALLFAFGMQAALVEYTYTGKGTYTGGGYQETIPYSGIMIYDTVSSNVTFVSWQRNKTFHVSTDTNLHFTTITGLKSKTYTVITGSGSGVDANGFYHLDDFMISGQNDALPIATNATFIFPKRFAGSNNRSLSPDTNDNAVLETWSETMTFFASRTKSDNDENLSGDDVVNALALWLQGKGYAER